MEVIDFDKCKKFNRSIKYFYEDDLDIKLYEDIEYNNDIWKLKYGPRYIYECYSEYIGSHVFAILGMPVHDTILGTCCYDGVVMPVVACKDFTTDRFLRFDEIVHLSIRGLKEEERPLLENELEIIIFWMEHQSIIDIKELKTLFFKMIFIDTFISNTDRNWENFGVLVNEKKQARFAPVFDNGDCLYSLDLNRDVNFIREILIKIHSNNYVPRKNFYGLENIIYRLVSLKDDLMWEPLRWVVDSIYEKKQLIENLIDDFPLISKTEKEFYKILLTVNHNFLCSLKMSIIK